MDISAIELDPKMTHATLQLALKVELLEGKRFRATKSVEELVELIKFSMQSDKQEVRVAMEDLRVLLSDEQKTFFAVLGLDLNASAVRTAKETKDQAAKKENTYITKSTMYRGATTSLNGSTNKSPSTPIGQEPKAGTYRGARAMPESDATEKPKGKRRVVYRGKEKWI